MNDRADLKGAQPANVRRRIQFTVHSGGGVVATIWYRGHYVGIVTDDERVFIRHDRGRSDFVKLAKEQYEQWRAWRETRGMRLAA